MIWGIGSDILTSIDKAKRAISILMTIYLTKYLLQPILKLENFMDILNRSLGMKTTEDMAKKSTGRSVEELDILAIDFRNTFRRRFDSRRH